MQQAESTKVEPPLDPPLVLTASQLVLVAVFAVFFLVLSYVPLRATDLWGHVSYGDWIVEHRELPAEDPFMHLAQGVPVVDAAWLSQVLLSVVHNAGGGEWLSNLFAATVLATHLLWAWIFYRQSRRPLLSLLGLLAILAVGWSRLFTLRPETFAALCFALLFWLLLGEESPGNRSDARAENEPDESKPERRAGRWIWIAVPALTALWANLHGSFLLAPVVLGCFFLGRALEVGWQTRRLAAIVANRSVQRWFGLAILGALATLINPYGSGLVESSLRFSGNENLRAIIEWHPLTLGGVGGPEFVISWIVLLLILGLARQRLPIPYVLLLIAFSAAVVSGVRFIGWYAPVFALVLVPQLSHLLPRRPRSIAAPVSGRHWGCSVVGLLLVFFTVALSPLSRGLFNRPPRSPAQLYGDSTPIAITRYLRQSGPQGQAFHPQHWGDWLLREGPPGLRPFVTMNLHLAPRPVWEDYLRIFAAETGWEEALVRYQINTVIVERRRQVRLMQALRSSANWRLASPPTDPQALAFVRIEESPAEGGRVGSH